MTQINSQNERVWFITGCASGLGKALAEAVVARGERLIATDRSEQVREIEQKAPGQVRSKLLDITNAAQVEAVIKEAISDFGRIDVVVNNAGRGLLGAVEEVSDAESRALFDTNFFGGYNVLRAVLPHLRQRRSGHIVNISSVSGLVSNPATGVYSATKFAVEGLTEALAQELAPLGIKVTLIEPGRFRTNFNGSGLTIAIHQIEDYAALSGQLRQLLPAQNGNQRGDPVRAALAIIQAVLSPRPPLRLVLGSDALEHLRNKLSRLQAELETWENLTLSTDFAAEPAYL